MTVGRPCEVQSCALPYRVQDGGKVEVLLITTRRTGRWSLPKGKISRGLSFAASAAKEAYEEAGVLGEIGSMSFASFRKTKRMEDGRKHVIEVWVYPLKVTRCLPHWPEQGQRDLRWCSRDEALVLLQDGRFGDAVRLLRC